MQVVDLQEDKDWRSLGVELFSLSPDPPDAWREAGEEMGVRDFETVLTDADNRIARKYGVMRWAIGGEPAHTFVLVDEFGEIAWLQDYGAIENGGIMYVLPHEVVKQVREHL
jgi:peroxiredoxin